MKADIIPVLAAITGTSQADADALFTSAWDAAKEANGGRTDTRTFTEAVFLFRSLRPFDLGELQTGQKALEDLEHQQSSPAK